MGSASVPSHKDDARLKHVAWRDLVPLRASERIWELTLSGPWLVGSLVAYERGWPLLGACGSFMFFLTGLRQSHNAQHRSLGIGRRGHDVMLTVLSVLMMASMHAIQTTHLHHHRHCLGDDDVEAEQAGWPWWRVLLAGPMHPLRLHTSAWRMANRTQRRWVRAELAAIAAVVVLAFGPLDSAALRWHVAAMCVGECMTGFFAVWIVHHGCDAHGQIARTQRGRLTNLFSYAMFMHLEHHLFPAVPTCHLHELADRLDRVAPEYAQMEVI